MQRKLHHILLVDDDPSQQVFSRRALGKTLSTQSTVHVVAGGDEAIAYMAGEGEFADRALHPFPTVVITDLNMPQGDGFDLLEFMQCNPEWGVVPRILFSSSDDDDDVRTAYLLGASAYHIKPSPSELEACMRRIMEYWTSCQVPPVDQEGRLLHTSSRGRIGARYQQLESREKMRRPDEPKTPSRHAGKSISRR